MTRPDDCCGNCRFWFTKDSEWGNCRHDPPWKPIGKGSPPGEWCGQHERAVMDENGRPTIMPAVITTDTPDNPTEPVISGIKLNADGSLYFVLQDTKRFMECVIEFDPSTPAWSLSANDSEIASW